MDGTEPFHSRIALDWAPAPGPLAPPSQASWSGCCSCQVRPLLRTQAGVEEHQQREDLMGLRCSPRGQGHRRRQQSGATPPPVLLMPPAPRYSWSCASELLWACVQPPRSRARSPRVQCPHHTVAHAAAMRPTPLPACSTHDARLPSLWSANRVGLQRGERVVSRCRRSPPRRKRRRRGAVDDQADAREMTALRMEGRCPRKQQSSSRLVVAKAAVVRSRLGVLVSPSKQSSNFFSLLLHKRVRVRQSA